MDRSVTVVGAAYRKRQKSMCNNQSVSQSIATTPLCHGNKLLCTISALCTEKRAHMSASKYDHFISWYWPHSARRERIVITVQSICRLEHLYHAPRQYPRFSVQSLVSHVTSRPGIGRQHDSSKYVAAERVSPIVRNRPFARSRTRRQEKSCIWPRILIRRFIPCPHRHNGDGMR